MPLGHGKYDDLCTKVREDAHAVAALVIVLSGNKGHGFSSQTSDLRVLEKLPEMLRNVARQIEESRQTGEEIVV